MPERRLDNGVMARADGGGDAWANAHRENLGSLYLLSDIDSALSCEDDAVVDTSDVTFIEYAPDAYKNCSSIIRDFGIVAFFERKANWNATTLRSAILSAGVQLHICRMYARIQPIAPRFFFVIGQSEPFVMQEIGIATGTAAGEPIWLRSGKDNWQAAWNASGLTNAHRILRAWLVTKKSSDKTQ